MKQRHTKMSAGLLALAGGLLAFGPATAQAQFTSTTLSDFNNFNLSVTYANWDVDGSDPLNGGTGFTPVITSGTTGYEIQAQGYGSGAYNFATPLNVPGATMFQLTFTLNTTTQHPDGSGLYLGPNVDITDGTHQVHLLADNASGGYLSYGNYAGPGTFTLTGSLNDQFGGAPLDTTSITAFNLEFDPAELGAGTPYDITYNSFQLLTPVPEPSTVSLVGMGIMAAAVALRRNRKQ